jgi:hypothetical protein
MLLLGIMVPTLYLQYLWQNYMEGEAVQGKSRKWTAVIGCAAEIRSSHWWSTKHKGLVFALLLANAANNQCLS